MRSHIRQFKQDLRAPLPGTEGLSRGARLKLRFKYLAAKYGWKFVVGFFVFYLVRDVVLYILLPWFAAKKLIFD